MPYVDLHCADDYVSIFYTTNTPRGNVSGFYPDKPSIIILHPLFLDSSWLQLQFGDPRLTSSYNMIAFDSRTSGKSSARPSGRHDSWVDAADLAFCHQALHLPPCHILALEGVSINCALRFAVLFPEMCLSLTLCNVPSPTEMKWLLAAYDELLHNWCHAEDLEAFEHVANESIGFVVGPKCDPDLQDDLIAYWEINMPPVRILRVAENQGVMMNRTPLKPEVLASITQPVLLLHGERNDISPKTHAEKLASQLTNAKGGAVLYTVKSGGGTMSILPTYASILNRVFTSFIGRLPHVGSELVPPETDKKERMRAALVALSEMAEDSSIASRDPVSSLSFSCLPQEVVQRQTEALKQYRKGIPAAFSPIGPDGRPFRKYSDRETGHWFHGERDGLSIAGKSFLPQEKAYEPARSEKPLSPQESAIDTRIRRTNVNTNSVEKPVIKGSMAKVVGTPAAQFQRLIV